MMLKIDVGIKVGVLGGVDFGDKGGVHTRMKMIKVVILAWQ